MFGNQFLTQVDLYVLIYKKAHLGLLKYVLSNFCKQTDNRLGRRGTGVRQSKETK